jgi:hypothetical protein
MPRRRDVDARGRRDQLERCRLSCGRRYSRLVAGPSAGDSFRDYHRRAGGIHIRQKQLVAGVMVSGGESTACRHCASQSRVPVNRPPTMHAGDPAPPHPAHILVGSGERDRDSTARSSSRTSRNTHRIRRILPVRAHGDQRRARLGSRSRGVCRDRTRRESPEALHKANLSPLILGQPLVLAAPHANVRRDGYRVGRPSSRGVPFDVPERVFTGRGIRGNRFRNLTSDLHVSRRWSSAASRSGCSVRGEQWRHSSGSASRAVTPARLATGRGGQLGRDLRPRGQHDRGRAPRSAARILSQQPPSWRC